MLLMPLPGAAPATLSNLTKATFDAVSKTYCYVTLDLWKESMFTKSPHQEFTGHLVKTHTRASFCAEDPGSSCGHHIISYKKKVN